MTGPGVHEYRNNPEEKKYSRSLGKEEGIGLIPVFQTDRAVMCRFRFI